MSIADEARGTPLRERLAQSRIAPWIGFAGEARGYFDARLRRAGIGLHVEADCGQLGGDPPGVGANSLEAVFERDGRAAVAADVVDGGLGAGDTEPGAKQAVDGFGLARGEDRAAAPGWVW